MNAALSIAIPARNEAQYIGTCIQSVLESARIAGVPVEVVVALITADEDSRLKPGAISAVLQKLRSAGMFWLERGAPLAAASLA
jgi:hypothetical protein